MSDEQQTEGRVYTSEDFTAAQNAWTQAEADTKFYLAAMHEAEAVYLRAVAAFAQARADEVRALASSIAVRKKWLESEGKAKAIAALEPAPDITFNDIEPVSEPEPEPSLFDEEGDTSSYDEDLGLTEAEVDAIADADDDAPSEFTSDLTGDPAVEPESGLHGEGEDASYPSEQEQAIAFASIDVDPEPTELDAPASILDDPELLAAVDRANATIATATYQDEPALGINDPELDREYDAMRARERSEKSFWGLLGKRKLEDA